jgi:hypothetical protein
MTGATAGAIAAATTATPVEVTRSSAATASPHKLPGRRA